MIPLITRADIALYKQITETPNEAKLNEMIIEAQILDVQPLLGEILYNKILSNTAQHSVLLNGGGYSYNNISYTNYGLKMVVAYYAYARYMMFGSIRDTASGQVYKNHSDSTPVDDATRKTIYKLNRDAANQIWDNVSAYLSRVNYPDFNVGCQEQQLQRGYVFYKIDG